MANDKKKIVIEISGDAESLKKAIDDSTTYIDKITTKIESIKATMLESAKSAITFGQSFGTAIKANLDLTLEFASRLAGIKGGLLGLLTLQNASYADLFGKFLIHAGALGLQINEAKKFESAFADAKKVISGTDDELAKVEKTIKRLASKEIPIDLTGLTDIAASGGQLGIATDQLEEYIQTTAQAGVAFEMLPKEAGTAIGGLTNIFNEPIKNIRLLLDQVNVLGDSTAATERDILDVMRFVGGEGKRFGLMKGEIAALIATMLSMQKPPEVVRTALNGLFSALTTGEMRSKTFNETLGRMGLSAEKLASDIKANPQATLVNFLETIGKFDKQGQSNLLFGLFGAGTDTGSIGDLATALDTLKANFSKVENAADASGSMLRTFETRAGTLENKAQLAANAVGVLAVEVGNPFLAPIKMATDTFHRFTDSLANFAAENPAITAFLRIIAVVKSLSLLLGSLSIITAGLPVLYARIAALPMIANIATFAATSGLGAFAGQIAIASIAVGLLTGTIGGFNSLMLSLIATVSLVGYNSLIAFRAAGAGATVLSAVLTGLRVSFISLLGAFGGGWIALLLVGLSVLIVAFANLKDKVFQLSGVSINLTEAISAALAIVSRQISQYIGIIGGYLEKFGGWLADLVGINAQTWNNIVSKFSGSSTDIGTYLKSIANTVAGMFDYIGQYAGIRMAQFVETIRVRMANAVEIAQAAGRDIRAAMSGEFSLTNLRATLANNADKVSNIQKQADDSIKQAGISVLSKDYVGGLFKTVSTAVVDEIQKQRASKKVGGVVAETRPTSSGIALPDAPDDADKKSGKAKSAKTAKPPQESEMHAFEAALEAQKIAYEKTHALQEFSKQDEKAYWDNVIVNYKGNSKTLADLKKKSADLDLAIIRENAKKELDLLKEQQQAKRDAALDALTEKEAAAQQEVDLGNVTQTEHLAQLRDFAKQRLDIELALLEEKRKLLGKDKLALSQNLHEKESLERAYRFKISGLARDAEKDKLGIFQGLFSPFKNAIGQMTNSVLTNQQTINNAIRNSLSSILLSYLSTFAQERVMQAGQWAWKLAGIKLSSAQEKAVKNGDIIWSAALWVGEKARMVGRWAWELAGFGAKETAKTTTKVVSETVQAGAVAAGQTAQTAAVAAGESARGGITLLGTLKAIGAKAAQAGAGAFSWVMTNVPFPFNAVLAPIAAAGAFAGTMAFGSMASSRDGLLEVPEDRLQFVHKKETILPARVAEPLRRMFETGRFLATGQVMPPNLNAHVANLVSSGLVQPNVQLPRQLYDAANAQNTITKQVVNQTTVNETQQAQQQPVKTRHELHVHTINADQIIKQGRQAVIKILSEEIRHFGIKK